MSDPVADHPKANQSSVNADARNVYRALPDWILSGAEAMSHVQRGVHNCSVPVVLQRSRQLPVLGQMRRTSVRHRINWPSDAKNTIRTTHNDIAVDVSTRNPTADICAITPNKIHLHLLLTYIHKYPEM